jgi:hypothetical protein
MMAWCCTWCLDRLLQLPEVVVHGLGERRLLLILQESHSNQGGSNKRFLTFLICCHLIWPRLLLLFGILLEEQARVVYKAV